MKLRSFAAWSMLLVAFVGAAQAQVAPTYSREQRLSRFHQFLGERKQALLNLGATPQTWSTPAGDYPNARLLHPNQVVSHLSYAINRYDSYQSRVQAQATSEGAVIAPVSFGVAVKPALYVSPENGYPRLAGEDDDSGSLGRAMAAAATVVGGGVWLTPGRTYELRRVLQIPSNVNLVSDGSATLLIKTGAGTSFALGPDPNDPSTSAYIDPPIQIIGRSGVVLRDFRVRLASESGDDQPLLRGGIHARNSSTVRIEGLELLGFPRTLGILRVNSGTNVTLRDNLIHGSYTRNRTRQVTGIEVDNDATILLDAAGQPVKDAAQELVRIYSSGVEIVGNFVLGMMLDNGVAFSSDSRYESRAPGQLLGYETDGINLAGRTANPILVANNSIMDVGEGIDTFGSNGTYRNNHIERAFALGFKLIHAASNNTFAGNRIIATGLSSILIDNTNENRTGPTGIPYKSPTGTNTFFKTRVRFTNAFNTGTAGGLPATFPGRSPVAGIDLSANTKRNIFYLSDVSEPMNQGSTGYVRGLNCDSSVAEPNVTWKDTIRGFAIPVNAVSSCVTVVGGAPLLAPATDYQNWTADGVRVETNVRYDLHGEQVTTDRIWSDVAGSHEVRLPLSLAGSQGRPLTLSTLVRRGTNSQLMLRDQISDWYTIFDVSGAGTVVQVGGAPGVYRGSSIVRLSDDWYWVAVGFVSNQSSALLTLRQMNSGPGLFMDLGETRLDVE